MRCHTGWLSHCFFMAKRQCLECSCTQSCAWVEAMIAKASLQSLVRDHLLWDHASKCWKNQWCSPHSNSPFIYWEANQKIGPWELRNFFSFSSARNESPTVTNVLKATANHAQIGSRAWANVLETSVDAVHHCITVLWWGYDQWPFQDPKIEVPTIYIRPI